MAASTRLGIAQSNSAEAQSSIDRCSAVITIPARFDVFRSGEHGYHTYRIPAAVVARDGTLLAFAEGRKNSSSDSGDIDLLLRRSSDGGATWSPQQVVWDNGPNVCGNPCPVVDCQTGTIWLLATHNLGTDREPQIISRESKGTRTVWLLRSEDHGATWSRPREITDAVKDPAWTWYATGPGAGIQLARGLHRGRLVIPCDHIDGHDYYSHVIYSDDHGITWERGGRTPADQVNECELVELTDGRLVLNMRNYDRSVKARQIAVSDDGGAKWRRQRVDSDLVEPQCQASIRRLRWPSDNGPGVILFSNPAHEDARVRMTVRASFDDTESWPFARVLYEGPSAYSCLVAMPDGSIGCFYEADDYRRIEFAKFHLDWLTNGPANQP